MSQSALFKHPILAVGQMRMPKEDSHAIPALITLSSLSSYTLDLTRQQEDGRMSIIQTVFIDNSQNGNTFTLAVANTAQAITAAPYTQGYYPILCTSAFLFTCSTTAATFVNVFLAFCNVPISGRVWTVLASNSSTGATPDIVDWSANAAAFPPPGVLLQTIPANTARNRIEIQNQSAATVYVARDDGTGAHLSVFILPSGGSAGAAGATWSNTTFKGRLRIYAPTGSQVAAYED